MACSTPKREFQKRVVKPHNTDYRFIPDSFGDVQIPADAAFESS
jgi:hypothetical protein